MSPSIISLIVWLPFLFFAILFGVIFCLFGYKRGAARAGISIGSTIIACILSILVAKLVAGGLAGVFAPMLKDGLISSGIEGGAQEVASLATSLASAVASVLLYIPIFAILVSIIKPVVSVIFKRVIPKPKHVANKIGGLSISLIDAFLLTMLILLPIYGTLGVTGDVVDVFADKNDESIRAVSAATDPFVVDVANVPPFSTAYDILMSCNIGGTNVSVSGTIRDTADVVRHAKNISNTKNGDFNEKEVLALLDSTEELLTDNPFITDFVCDFLGGNLPSVKVPGIGKIKPNEYYPALSDSKQFRKDLPAFFDLSEAMVKSGMVEALVNKDNDMSQVDAKMISKAFGNTLNHSNAIATFKSNLLKNVVDTFSKDIIEKGNDTDGSVKALCDALSAVPSEPMSKDDAIKEGESFYLLISGLISSSNKKTSAMGVGMMLEGLARHPMVGVDKVINAAEAIVESSGNDVSDALLVKLKENLRLAVDKPVGENFFGKYSSASFAAIDAFGSIASGDSEDSEENKSSSNESMKELITSDKEALGAVKDTISSELVKDMGIDDEDADAYKGVIDATLDSIIETDCPPEDVDKEAAALGNVFEAVTEVTESPENTDDVVKEYATEIIDECLESKIVSGMIQRLASKGKPDPLGLFKNLTDDAKVTVGETIDEYISEAETEEDVAVLEAFKIFVGVIND